jgi:carbamoylphosphate synthase large subunit
VLIVTWQHWPSAARITAELIAAGANVDVLSSDLNPILSVKGISKRYRYRRAAPSRSLTRAIDHSEPQLIVAADDVAIGHLLSLRRTGPPDLAALIGHSLGPSESYETIASRARFVASAQSAGLDAPDCAEITTTSELEEWLHKFGLPAFLKLDGTCGGEGVRLVRTADEARAAFTSVSRHPDVSGVFERETGVFKVRKSDARLLKTHGVSVQKAVMGRSANCSAFAWHGEVLSVVSVETLKTLHTFGVATVVRPVENRAMRHAAVAIAHELKLSGFFGLDFILHPDGDRASVLELNPRPTPISHFALGPGRDLVAALIAKLEGRAPVERPVAFRPNTDVAIFPHLLRKHDGEPQQQNDLPEGQPQLIGAFARRRKLADCRGQLEKWLGARESADVPVQLCYSSEIAPH